MSPNKKKKVVLLHNILDLKVNCMETEICKVGFSKNSLNKYIKLIQEKGYSYILYNFDNNTSKLTILNKYNGNKINNIEENKLQLIPKSEKYIEYILQIIIKLPRTEKFNIGNEYKQSMYKML